MAKNLQKDNYKDNLDGLGISLEHVESAVFKAISLDRECSVSHFGTASRTDSENNVTLPFIPDSLSEEDWNERRGEVDSMSLSRLRHDSKLHKRLSPSDPNAAEIFDALENVRVLSWRGELMQGMQNNITRNLNKKYHNVSVANESEDKSKKLLPLAIAMLLRKKMTGQEPPQSLKKTCDNWQQDIEESIGCRLDELKNLIDNQELFASEARKTIADFWPHISDVPMSTETDKIDNENSEDTNEEFQTQGEEGQSQEEQNNMDAPLPQAQGEDSSQSSSEQSESNAEISEDGESQDPLYDETHDYPDDIEELYPNAPKTDYKIYCREFDEVVQVSDITTPEELMTLRQDLDSFTENLAPLIVRTANKLQRYLLAQQERSWLFDLEDGWLDTSKLSRIVVNPTVPASYKIEKTSEFRDSIITLLIDNSGSMRGRPITVAAVTADILTRTLERCGVKVEVLGFTTSLWKGGKPKEKWLNSGKPQNPGRLNSLLHIVYKSADIPYRMSKLSFGVMLKEGLLKENIDGEALLWAYNKLLIRPEKRRILMTISDGAPVDDATLSANSGQYLDNHLREVIKFIENSNQVELIAIGIGHDVTRYYKNATTINYIQHLGEVMTSQLMSLFKPPRRQKK